MSLKKVKFLVIMVLVSPGKCAQRPSFSGFMTTWSIDCYTIVFWINGGRANIKTIPISTQAKLQPIIIVYFLLPLISFLLKPASF